MHFPTRRGRDATPPPTHRSWRLAGINIAIILSLAALCGLVLKHMRDIDLAKAQQNSQNLAAALAADIGRNVELYDAVLRGVAQGLKRPDMYQLPRELRHALLFERIGLAKNLHSIVVTDELGNTVIDSHAMPEHVSNYAGADFFRKQRDKDGVGLFAGTPHALSDGTYVLTFSRRLNKPDGTFGGVVAGHVALAYFYDLLKNAKIPPTSSISITHTDGVLIMRSPFDINLIGRDFKNSEIHRGFSNAADGSFEAVARTDGVRRLYVFEAPPNAPLRVSVNLSLDDIYASWWKEALLIALLVTFLCGVQILLTFLLMRELRGRQRAEVQLNVLANTDQLTGLSNRRGFDRALTNEWRRAMREHTAISLLMIDADKFKSYNDLYGHPMGDEALRTIAAVLAEACRRPGDVGARYGGEEFAVLLPGTTESGAISVAENVRSRIAEVVITTREGVIAVPTVSIGISSVKPHAGIGPSDLLSRADKALYRAKANGRDRIEVEPERLEDVRRQVA